jgi:glycosyltransferase involved in cell wall biosynthesis
VTWRRDRCGARRPRAARFIDVVDKRSIRIRLQEYVPTRFCRGCTGSSGKSTDIVPPTSPRHRNFFIEQGADPAYKHNPRKADYAGWSTSSRFRRVWPSVRHDNVKVIYNGIHPVHLPNDTSVNNVFNIIAVGRLDKIKAFDRLVNECSKLEFDFNLVIVGDGTERVTLENLATDLKIKYKVTFLGFRRDVPQLMQKSDVVVVCSLSEGFSLVLIEAMFYSKW